MSSRKARSMSASPGRRTPCIFSAATVSESGMAPTFSGYFLDVQFSLRLACATPSPIQERQQGSGDRDEIRKAQHALLGLPRHRAQLLQENAAREPAGEAPPRPERP